MVYKFTQCWLLVYHEKLKNSFSERVFVKTDFRLVIESIILLKNLKISYFYKCVTVAAELFHLLCTVYLHFPGIPGGGLCEPHQHSVPHSSPHSVWVRTHFRLSNCLLEYSFILHTESRNEAKFMFKQDLGLYQIWQCLIHCKFRWN